MTETPTLRKCSDGYYRTSWVTEAGKRRQKSFGRKRNDAHNRFNAWLVQWRADATVRNAGPAITIRQGWDLFQEHAKEYYRRADGTPTNEPKLIEYAMQPVLDMYGDERMDRFTPAKLESVREWMIEAGWSVTTINARVMKIVMVFKRLVGRQAVPAAVWQSLKAVESLRPGRSRARQTEPVEPVHEEWVWKTCRHLPPTLQAMVEFQYWTGCRPGEVCNLTAGQIDMSGEIWVYRPTHHKTVHHGHVREIMIGPRGQAVIRPFLQRDINAPLFSPTEAMRQRQSARVDQYQPTKGKGDYRRWPSYLKRCAERGCADRYRDRYTTTAYRRAIISTCERHDLPTWSPNQLRHAAATRVRASRGLEAAQVVLGHAQADTTQVYAERDRQLAMQVMKEIG